MSNTQYDFDYFEVTDIEYPEQPHRPVPGVILTSQQAFEFAEKFKEYEIQFEAYKNKLVQYRTEKAKRLKQLKQMMMDDQHMNPEEFEPVWKQAFFRVQHKGLQAVCAEFQRLAKPFEIHN